ncbi:MAG: GH32 C-terminal domain-containing protein [Demequina sp.]|uniref:GH32 C-terminal domain-containing protein n=1 Tax=Demequina sp. TaxID=2050685 RepID=UPI003A844B0F
MNQRGFFRPQEAWVGDVIPWVEDDVFHLFYLHETRRTPALGMPWRRLTSDSLTSFSEGAPGIEFGGPEADDFNIYTGSIVLDAEGTHHAFYTGQNPLRRGPDGRPLQLVMHASSRDGMETWERHPEHTFGATEGYETGDWRDPFVLWDAEAGHWRMLITARHSTGPERRRGVIAQCISHDLATWEPAEAFWNPQRYVAHECPEIFQWGDWWYLVYSEFSDGFVTRYRMARSLEGPWIAPEFDSLDGRAYYAAKSVARAGRRYFFGWIASREGNRDDGPWQWAGTLHVLEAHQRANGTLAFHPTDEARAEYDAGTSLWRAGTVVSAPDGYTATMAAHEPGASARLRFRLDIAPDCREVGVLIRASADGDEAYVIRLEPQRGRMVFDRWPRRVTGGEQWQISGDVPHLVELERPCRLEPGVHELEVILEGDMCVATVDNATVLSTRIYDRPEGLVGVFASDGTVTIVDATAHAPATAASDREPSSVLTFINP